MIASFQHPAVVNNATPQETQIAEDVNPDFVLLYVSYFCDLPTDLLIPVCIDKHNYCPARLPLIEFSLRVRSEEFVCTNCPVMNHIRAAGVFDACPDDHRLAVLNPTRCRMQHTSNLALNTNLVTLEPGE